MRSHLPPAAIRAGKKPYRRLTLSTGVSCVVIPPSCMTWACALNVPQLRQVWGAFIELPARHPWVRHKAHHSILPPTAFLTEAPWGCAEHGWADLMTMRPWLRVTASTRHRAEQWADAVAQVMRYAEPDWLTATDLEVLLLSANPEVRQYAVLLTQDLEGGGTARTPDTELPVPVRGWRCGLPGFGGAAELLQDAEGAWYLRHPSTLVRRLPSVPWEWIRLLECDWPADVAPSEREGRRIFTVIQSGDDPEAPDSAFQLVLQVFEELVPADPMARAPSLALTP